MNKIFVSDLELDELYHAHIIRSEEVGAKIININLPKLHDGYSFFSAKDIPGKNSIRFFNSSIPVFADDVIDYKGQAIGILIGPDKRIVLQLSEQITVELSSANQIKSKYTFEDEEKNYFDYPIIAREILTSNNTEQIFETSNKILHSTFSTKQKYHYHSETSCVKVSWNNERMEFHLATQWPYHVLQAVSEVLHSSKQLINVIPHKECESLDGRMWFPSLLAAQVAVPAFLSKKNISIEFSRKDDFLYTTKSPNILIQHKTAVSDTGDIQAMDVSIIVDQGFFNPLINEMLKQMVVTSSSIYSIPSYNINAIAIKTEQGLTDLFNGLGDSYVTSALEKHINEIVETFDFCPIQFRLQNKLPVSALNIVGAKNEDEVNFENIFKAVCSTSDFYRKFYAYRLMNRMRKNRYDGAWRGAGIAVGYQYNGSNILVRSGMNYSAEITLTKDDKVLVKAEPSSENLKRILRKNIAKELEVEETQIVFLGQCTDELNSAGAAISSFGITILPDLIAKCCTGIKGQRFRTPLPITVSRNYKISKTKDWDNNTLNGSAFISKTPGACVIEMELNPSVYEISIRGIWFACCPGKIYSKKLVHQNIHKAIATAISNISVEEVNACLTNCKYKIINTGDIPSIRVFILENDFKTCGLGELAGALVPAAYLSALNQIMVNHIKINSVPVLTKDIFNSFVKADIEVDE